MNSIELVNARINVLNYLTRNPQAYSSVNEVFFDTQQLKEAYLSIRAGKEIKNKSLKEKINSAGFYDIEEQVEILRKNKIEEEIKRNSRYREEFFVIDGETYKWKPEWDAARAITIHERMKVINNFSLETIKYTEEFDPFIGYKHGDLPHAKDKKEWLIDGICMKNGSHQIIGCSKSGKSWIGYQIAYCLEHGIDFLGHKTHKSKCLYVDWELGQEDIDERCIKLELKFGKEMETMFIPLACTFYEFDYVLSRVRNCLDRNPDIDVVFFDNFYSFFEGNINDSTDVKNILKRIKCVKENITTFIIFHTNKADGKEGGSKNGIYAAGGSNAIGAFATETISIVKNSATTRTVYVSGRNILGDDIKITCSYDGIFTCIVEDTVEDAQALLDVDAKPHNQLLEEYYELTSFIDEHSGHETLAKINNHFGTDYTEDDIKSLGFWWSGSNKKALKDDTYKAHQVYTRCPYKVTQTCWKNFRDKYGDNAEE